MKALMGAFLIGAALCGLAVVSMAVQTSWVDEINNSLSFTAANYPGSNWEPYKQKLGIVPTKALRQTYSSDNSPACFATVRDSTLLS